MATLTEEMGIQSPVQEFLVGGVTQVDIAFPDAKVVLECNGPWHYMHLIGMPSKAGDVTMPPGAMWVAAEGLHLRDDYVQGAAEVCLLPTGRSRSKMKLLADLGWTVAAIPYWDWRCLQDNEARKRYVRSILKQHLGSKVLS